MGTGRTGGTERAEPSPAGLLRARRRSWAALLGLATPVLAVACVGPAPDEPRSAGPAVQVGAGVGDSGAWTAWAYPTTDGGSCLEVRGIPGAGTSCMARDSTSISLAGIDTARLISGGTSMADAAGASVTFADGTVARVAFLGAAGAPHRYFVTVLPTDPVPVQFALVDAAGMVLDQMEIDPPAPNNP